MIWFVIVNNHAMIGLMLLLIIMLLAYLNSDGQATQQDTNCPLLTDLFITMNLSTIKIHCYA